MNQDQHICFINIFVFVLFKKMVRCLYLKFTYIKLQIFISIKYVYLIYLNGCEYDILIFTNMLYFITLKKLIL